MKLVDAVKTIEEKILSGKYGPSGTRLPPARELAEKERVSFVNTLAIIKILKSKHLLFSIGNKNYVAYGECSSKSDLRKEIADSNKIAILIPTLLNPYYSSVAEKLNIELSVKGYTSVIFTHSNGLSDIGKIFDNIVNDKCLALISFTPDINDDVAEIYRKFPLPFVLIGNILETIDATFITSENYNSGLTVAQHLTECGYEEFVYIRQLNPNSKMITDYRYLGFKQGIAKLGMEFNETNIFYYDINNSVSKYNILQKIKSLSEKKRIGIFCYHDLIASDIYMLLSNSGISIPRQVGIVGYDDLKTASTLKITTCSYNFTEIASKACEVIEKKIYTDKVPNQNIKIKTILVIRASTR